MTVIVFYWMLMEYFLGLVDPFFHSKIYMKGVLKDIYAGCFKKCEVFFQFYLSVFPSATAWSYAHFGSRKKYEVAGFFGFLQ